MLTFNVWLSVLTASYEPIIRGGLVAMGYTVQAATADTVVIGNCIAYKVGHPTKKLKEVEFDIVHFLVQNKIYYHMCLVIYGVCDAIWRNTNIDYSTIKSKDSVDETFNKLLGPYTRTGNTSFGSHGTEC